MASTPDYILAGAARLLSSLLPLFLRTPGAVSDVSRYATMRATVRRLLDDTRAAARSNTLADDLATIASNYRRSSDDPRAVIDGLLRVAIAARAFQPVEARSAVLLLQRTNEQVLTLLIESLALAECAQACAALVPRSNEDATRLRRVLTENFDRAIERAADFGHAMVLRALRDAQGKVARDLIERGRPLAHVVGYETATPLPAVVLAHRLYQDASRRDELTLENSATDHPAFMPMTGRAYSR